jgi:hypothetical protein
VEEREQAVVLWVAPRVGEEEPEVSHRVVARGCGGRRRLVRPWGFSLGEKRGNGGGFSRGQMGCILHFVGWFLSWWAGCPRVCLSRPCFVDGWNEEHLETAQPESLRGRLGALRLITPRLPNVKGKGKKRSSFLIRNLRGHLIWILRRLLKPFF